MYSVVVAVIIVVCIVLAVVVLMQNSKGGGLAANFSSVNQIVGVRKATDGIEKLTWGLAIALVVLSIVATASIPNHNGDGTLHTNVQVENTMSVNMNPMQNAAPVQAAAPVQEQSGE